MQLSEAQEQSLATASSRVARQVGGALEEQKTVNVYCRTCKIGSPREPSELARPSGRMCLVCGAALVDEMPWPIIEKNNGP
jgi:hypothetical protein